MSLSIFSEQIQQQIIKSGLKELNEEQISILKSLKSGQDFLFEGIEMEDILTLSALTLVQRIPADEGELFPRALVLCSEIDTCLKLEVKLNAFAKITGLVSVVTHDKGKKIEQRNKLYEGCDVVIANPRRAGELYFQNGINLKNLKAIILIDSNEISKTNGLTPIARLNESINKCQKIAFYKEMTNKLEEFYEEFLINPKTIEK